MSIKGHLREIVLGIGFLVIVLWYFSPSAPPLPGEDAAKAAEEGDALLALVDRLPPLDNLDAMLRKGGEYDGSGRNLFDYGVVKPKGPSPEELARLAEERRKKAEADRLKREEAERLRKEAQARLDAQAREEAVKLAQQYTPPPPSRPVPPTIDLKFIGIIGDPKDKIAIFLDGKEFLLAKEGDEIKKDFVLREIGYDTLKMGFTDSQFEDEIRILPMGESK